MADGEHEDTLTISLVDGLTCGLASTLLLLIIFGMNLAMPTLELGGRSGQGTFGSTPTDLPGEPVDIIVEITGAPKAVHPSSGFGGQSDDHKMTDEEGGRTVFLRHLPEGLSSRNTQAQVRSDIQFKLKLERGAQAGGTIHIFRAGARQRFDFTCVGDKSDFNLIQDFDLRESRLIGDCT